MEKIKIMIADDHPVVREGLRSIFELEDELEVVAEAQDGEEAIRKAKEFTPDVVLMDIRMPGLDGVAASRKIKEIAPNTKILVLTSFEDDEEVKAAIDTGVEGYLLKDTPSSKIVEIIKSVREGGSFLHPSVTTKVLQEFRLGTKSKKEDAFGLSERELEVLRLIAQGLQNKEIAKALWLSEATVKAHVSNILRKLDAHDRAQAALLAAREGLIDLSELKEDKIVDE